MESIGAKKVNFRRARRAAKYAMLAAALAFFTVAIFLRPERYIERCAEGIALWAKSVLPSLFPFMVVCAIFTNTGIAAKASSPLARAAGALKLPPCAAACFVMSACSGYPAGSRTVSEFCRAGYTDAAGANKLACLCSACGPLFAIGTVGAGFYGDAATGAKLFAAHIISVVTLSLIFSLAGKKPAGSQPHVSLKGDVLQESFFGAVQAALTAGAFIAFFYTAAAVAEDFYILYPFECLLKLFTDGQTAEAFCSGLVEMTGGCAALSKAGGALSLPLTGFLITFGGSCVLAQQLSYLTRAKVRAFAFIAQKFAQGVLCFLLLLLMQ